MALIQSATGPIDTADLGFTLMHEHIYAGWSVMQHQYPELLDRDALREDAVAQFREASAVGVRTIVDLTPMDLGRDAALIRDVAEQSGVQVIVATGFYFQFPLYFFGRPDQEMVDLLVGDITVGISDTGVRAGVIKCATQQPLDPLQERVLRASARAHRETGVPICTHTNVALRNGLEQQRVFREEGVDLGRTVIGHSDDSDDVGYLEEIIANGSYCGMDRFGVWRSRSSEARADMVATLVAKGYADRITLSHDACCRHDLITDTAREAMPASRLTHITDDVIPMLLQRGVSASDIEQMTVRNPRRIFEQDSLY